MIAALYDERSSQSPQLSSFRRAQPGRTGRNDCGVYFDLTTRSSRNVLGEYWPGGWQRDVPRFREPTVSEASQHSDT